MGSLKEIKLFLELTDAQLSRLVDTGTWLEFAAGEVLIQEGSEGASVFAILSGDVDVELNTDSGVTVASRVTGGDILGETVLLGRPRRIASAVALGEVVTLHWNVADLYELFENDAHTAFLIMRNVARGLQDKLVATNATLRTLQAAEDDPPADA